MASPDGTHAALACDPAPFAPPVSTELLQYEGLSPYGFSPGGSLYGLDFEHPPPGSDAFWAWLHNDDEDGDSGAPPVPTACPSYELPHHTAPTPGPGLPDEDDDEHPELFTATMEAAMEATATFADPECSAPAPVPQSSATEDEHHPCSFPSAAMLVPQAFCIAVPASGPGAPLPGGRLVAWRPQARPRLPASQCAPPCTTAAAQEAAKAYLPQSLLPRDSAAIQTAAQQRRQKWDLIKAKRSAALSNGPAVRYEKRRVCAVARPRVQGRFVRKQAAPAAAAPPPAPSAAALAAAWSA